MLLSAEKLKRRLRDGFGSSPYHFPTLGKRTLKIMYVKRLDAYAGLCKDLCVDYDMNPSFCICRALADIPEANYIVSQYRPMSSTGKRSCDEECGVYGMSCYQFAAVLYRTSMSS
jgi:hypothetical protein